MNPQETDGSGADWRSSFREAGPYLGLGAQLAGAMLFFVGLGYLLDRLLATEPWMTVAGGLLGIVAVFVKLVRVANELGRKTPRTKRRERKGGAA